MKTRLESLAEVKNPKGNITKILNKKSKSFKKFGEIYLSKINKNSIKAWKKHTKIHINLAVILGKVKFVVYNDYKKNFTQIILSGKKKRIFYIPAKLWFGFKGLEKKNTILSISSEISSEKEIKRKKLKEIKYNW